MKANFEAMVQLIHDYQIKGGKERVAQKEEELVDAQNKLQMLRQDDSEARELAQGVLDIASQLKA